MTGVGGSARYGVRRIDAAKEGETIAALMSEGFPYLTHASIAAKIASQYIHNPAGRSDCFVLEESRSGEVAGMQGLVRRRFEWADAKVRTATMADYLVRPLHRSLGPAMQLLKSTVDRGRETHELLYGFPNEKARLIFSRAGFKPAARMIRFGMPVRAAGLLRSRMPAGTSALLPVASVLGAAALAGFNLVRRVRHFRGWAWEERTDFTSEFDDLWRTRARAGLLLSDRSSEMLRWRYPESPDRRITVAYRRVGGPIIGYVVWTLNDRTLVIRDFFCADLRRDLTPLIAGFTARARRAPAESISMELAGPPWLEDAIRRGGLIPRDSEPVYLLGQITGKPPEDFAESLFLTSFDRDSA